MYLSSDAFRLCAWCQVCYSHAKAPPPKPKDGNSAGPKAKGKAALATVAILAATMRQPSQAGQIEWAAGSGPGRHLTSFEAVCEQGYDRSFFDGFSSQSQESLRFSTGGGQRHLSMSIGFQDRSGLFGKANHFILDSCPLVRSTPMMFEKRRIKSPCARLYKSLHGRPESSAHWQAYLSEVLQKQLEIPSVFWFPSMRLVLSVYVDDLALAGEKPKREGFWKTLN